MRGTSSIAVLILLAGCSSSKETVDPEPQKTAVPIPPRPGNLAPAVEQLDPADLGFELCRPHTDGEFVVGGVNATTTIRALTALRGTRVDELERRMRPGAAGEMGSEAGFLGPDERLIDVLAEDNRYVVDELGRTHQELARPLLLLGYFALKNGASDVRFRGVPLQVDCIRYRGYQESPFADGTRASIDVTVRNLATGATLSYSLLVPHMIERYGFYEGHGTSYRVDPRAVVEVLQL